MSGELLSSHLACPFYPPPSVWQQPSVADASQVRALSGSPGDLPPVILPAPSQPARFPRPGDRCRPLPSIGPPTISNRSQPAPELVAIHGDLCALFPAPALLLTGGRPGPAWAPGLKPVLARSAALGHSTPRRTDPSRAPAGRMRPPDGRGRPVAAWRVRPRADAPRSVAACRRRAGGSPAASRPAGPATPASGRTIGAPGEASWGTGDVWRLCTTSSSGSERSVRLHSIILRMRTTADTTVTSSRLASFNACFKRAGAIPSVTRTTPHPSTLSLRRDLAPSNALLSP